MTRLRFLLLPVALSTLSCEWVQDRFRVCRDFRIDLVNDVRNGPALNMAMHEDPYSDSNLVPPAGSRRVEICAERGDAKRIRVGQNGVTLAIANCQVSRHEHEFEFSVARVVWDAYQARCENW
jgi:hypothetical protein